MEHVTNYDLRHTRQSPSVHGSGWMRVQITALLLFFPSWLTANAADASRIRPGVLSQFFSCSLRQRQCHRSRHFLFASRFVSFLFSPRRLVRSRQLLSVSLLFYLSASAALRRCQYSTSALPSRLAAQLTYSTQFDPALSASTPTAITTFTGASFSPHSFLFHPHLLPRLGRLCVRCPPKRLSL
jgi:hypothetical protein